MRTFSLAMVSAWAGARGSMCPGAFDFFGYGQVSLTNSGYADGAQGGAGQIMYDVADNGAVALRLNDRSYFGDVCNSGAYSPKSYSAVKLLGKRMKYTTDMAGAGCGCNVAMYLVSMAQNPKISTCGDYYCDANKVCGIACTEIDIQEGNRYSWHSTLHAHSDKYGKGAGYGGGDTWNGPRDFTGEQFGPGGSCVDTLKPFQVTTSFPVGADGMLIAMEVELTQVGKDCPLKMRVADYKGMVELTMALWEGMTPVVSYWSSKNMLWMDGQGEDGLGPCQNDTAVCGDFAKFYDFSVEDLPGVTVEAPQGAIDIMMKEARKEARNTTASALLAQAEAAKTQAAGAARSQPRTEAAAPAAVAPAPAPAPAQQTTEVRTQSISEGTAPAQPGDVVPVDNARTQCTEIGEDCSKTHCCRDSGMRCFEKNMWWAECKETCLSGFKVKHEEHAWSCRPLGARTPDLREHELVMLSVPEQEVPPVGSQVTLVLGEQQILGKMVTESHPDTTSRSSVTISKVSKKSFNDAVGDAAQKRRERGSQALAESKLDRVVATKKPTAPPQPLPQPILHA